MKRRKVTRKDKAKIGPMYPVTRKRIDPREIERVEIEVRGWSYTYTEGG